ncbi:hypothetical protein D3C73_1536170 [compost metagenome]
MHESQRSLTGFLAGLVVRLDPDDGGDKKRVDLISEAVLADILFIMDGIEPGHPVCAEKQNRGEADEQQKENPFFAQKP